MKTIICFLSALLFMSSAFGDTIKPNQTLQIGVLGVPPSEQARLNSTYTVSSSGTITLWAIGTVRAAGKTPTALATSISAAYRSAGIYTSPNFQVNIPNKANKVVEAFTVGGAIRGPGSKPYTDGLTLYSAVQAAGGPTEFGAMNRVKLYRRGKVQTYNLKTDRHKSVKIYPGDVIEVPQKKWNGQ